MHRLIIGDELVLHGDVGDLWGDGSGFTSREVLEALAELGPKDITVRLNSGGGFVWDGVGIYNALLAHAGKITMLIDGIAASAASVIACAGSKVIMGDGAQIMIHDPSAITFGDAIEHQTTADQLNRLGDQVATIYATKTGKDAKELRTMMLAETWFDAKEAINVGFADETMAPAEKEKVTAKVSKFDYRLYQKVPQCVMSIGQRPLPANPEEEPTMTDAEKAAKAAADKAAADKALQDAVAAATTAAATATAASTKSIMDRCKVAKLSLDETSDIVSKSNGDVTMASGLIIDAIAARAAADVTKGTQPVITADARDKFLKGVTLSLMGKANLKGGERNEFTGLQLREIARMCLQHAGQAVPNDPMTMVAAAFRPMMAAGQHSTSDFANILADVAHKAMLIGHEEAEETFQLWTAVGNLSDFKTHNRIDLGLFPSLSEVPEGAEYKYATVSDRKVTIALATYGKMFAITRQAIINDDMSVFTRIPNRMGRAAKRTVGNLVYAILTANAAMADGVVLFHADHNNLAGSGAAPTVATVDAGRAAMALQQDPDAIATGGLNIRPAFFLVPVELEGTAKVLMTSEFNPANTQRVPNHVRGMMQVVSEARLSTDSATEWYMAAAPNAIDTIEVAYLNGVQTPVLEQRDGWNVDGVEMKVRLDAGVQVLDYRGLYKNPGA